MVSGRRVCLSGMADHSRDWVHKVSVDEIWGMNEGHSFLKLKPTRWFQLHPKDWNLKYIDKEGYLQNGHWKEKWPHGNYGRHPAHVRWLSKLTCPVYMREVDERIPTAVKFPLDELVEKYGRYFTSTIAYMLGLLLYEHEQYRWWKPWTWKKKVSYVVMTGIEMALGTEYMIQRPCAEYFLGRLEQAGVEVGKLPIGTQILEGPLYAVDHDAPILEGELVPIRAGTSIKTENLPKVKAHEDVPV